jgi:UDP-2,3-diacylglucosamine hydrolase
MKQPCTLKQSCTWFISDLHLCETRPAVTAAFLGWLKTDVAQAERICILGDFFEVWLGDDTVSLDAVSPVVAGLKALTAQGVEVLVMHGNRDFLLGEGFEQATGVKLIADPTLVEWYGKRLLLTHGDGLCTDDQHYQQFKAQVRAPAWQSQFLAQPLPARQAFATKARQQSGEATAMKDAMIMDVNADAVAQLFKQYDYPVMMHGHTHRPQLHTLDIDGHACERWVLGDWHTQASCLRLDSMGLHRVILDLS